jgi:hypothetical protein
VKSFVVVSFFTMVHDDGKFSDERLAVAPIVIRIRDG